MLRSLSLAATLAVAAAMPAGAHHDGDMAATDGVVVSHAHSVAVSATSHAVAMFMTIENTTDAAVTLTGVEVDFAAPGVFQAPSVSDTGTLSVREVSAVEITPGQSVTMQPGGLHVVLTDVQREMGAGDHFHAHLQFEGMGEMEIDVAVERAEDVQDHLEVGETG